MTCRRGHADQFVKYRRKGGKYCNKCQAMLEHARVNGYRLAKLPPNLKKLDRYIIKMLARRKNLSIVRMLDLSGINRDCLGAYYQRGAGPDVRHKISVALKTPEALLFP